MGLPGVIKGMVIAFGVEMGALMRGVPGKVVNTGVDRVPDDSVLSLNQNATVPRCMERPPLILIRSEPGAMRNPFADVLWLGCGAVAQGVREFSKVQKTRALPAFRSDDFSDKPAARNNAAQSQMRMSHQFTEYMFVLAAKPRGDFIEQICG